MSVLDSLDDCTVICGHTSERVRANTFVLVQNCDIFRMAYEDMLEDESREFPAPNVEGRIMQLLVNLLHKKIHPSDITSIDDLLEVFEAMRYLACTYKRHKLSQQLWELVRQLPASNESMGTIVKTAPHLLETHPREFLSKSRVVSKMRFDTFRRVFDSVDMSPDMAKTCMSETMAHFSPLLILHALVHVAPPGLKFHTVLECLSLYKVGCYFHPAEYLMGLHMLQEYRSSSKLDIPPYVMDLSKATLDACHNINSPACLATADGSLVTIQGKPRASFFIHLKKLHRKVRLQFQHNVAQIHRDGTVLECRFLLRKLGEYSHVANDAHVRITYIPEEHEIPIYDKAGERWLHVPHVDHDDHDAIDIRDDYGVDLVTYIRIDLFWLHNPVNL